MLIPIVWTEYTATLQGRILKLVPCENCSTEYVYVLEREGIGCGKSLYMLNDEGALQHAQASAEEALQSYLENDFEPISCPTCGHYQKYMFPKLYDGGPAWIQVARLVSLVAGCLIGIGVFYWGVMYLQRPGDRAFWGLAVTLTLLAALGLISYVLSVRERAESHRFNPNTEVQHARIEKGRSRASTRAEFEAALRRSESAGMPDQDTVSSTEEPAAIDGVSTKDSFGS